MSIETIYLLIKIFLVLFGLILLAGIIVIVYFLGKQSVKNNPEKGLVFIKDGNLLSKPVSATGESKDKGSYRYNYNNKTVLVPAKYGELYYRGKRLIFISKNNQLISSPFDKDIPIAEDERNTLIYEFVESKVGGDMVRAIQGKSSSLNIIIVAVAAFVFGIVAVFGYQYINNTMITQQQQQQQQQQKPVANENQLPEVK